MENPDIDAPNQRRSTLILLDVCVGQLIVGLDRRALPTQRLNRAKLSGA